MSIISDAERYLQLAGAGLITDESPLDVIRGLVQHFHRYGVANQLVSQNQNLQKQIVELECRVSEANGRTREAEHTAVQLEEGIRSDLVMSVWKERVRSLETKLREANERTRLVEHRLIQVEKDGRI